MSKGSLHQLWLSDSFSLAYVSVSHVPGILVYLACRTKLCAYFNVILEPFLTCTVETQLYLVAGSVVYGQLVQLSCLQRPLLLQQFNSVLRLACCCAVVDHLCMLMPLSVYKWPALHANCAVHQRTYGSKCWGCSSSWLGETGREKPYDGYEFVCNIQGSFFSWIMQAPWQHADVSCKCCMCQAGRITHWARAPAWLGCKSSPR